SVRASALTALMIVDFAAKRYAECIIVARTMIENSPEHSAGHLYLAAALAMQDELTAAAEALAALLRLRPELSLAWMRQNLPPAGDLGERLRDGLRKAGVPEA